MTSLHSSRDFSETPRTSSFCAANGCVGLVPHADGIDVVDTKKAAGARLRVTREELRAFVRVVKAGRMDMTL